MKIIITFFLISLFTPVLNEEFEGIIHYQHEYVSNVLNVDSLKEGQATQSIYYWKGANYKGVHIGVDTSIYLYNGYHAVCYYTRTDFNGYYCFFDYSQSTDDSLIEFELQYDQEIILGEMCDLLILRTKNSTAKYYYSKKYRVNPEDYKRHKAYFWDFYMEKARGGVIMKSITEFKDYQVVMSATKITGTPLMEDVFYVDKTRVLDCD